MIIKATLHKTKQKNQLTEIGKERIQEALRVNIKTAEPT